MGEWISVKDRLPEPSAYYLVYSARERHGKIFKFFYVAYLRKVFNGSFIWQAWGRNNLLKGVTHWQPLLEPPNE